MTKKRLLAMMILAIMLFIMIPVGVVFASEVIILDTVFDNTYVKDNLAKNHNGNILNDPECSLGKRWGVNWGGEGHFMDAEDGSLALGSKVGTANNGEVSMYRRLIHETLVDNSTLVLTFRFKTGSKPTASSNELWFRFYSEVDGNNYYWTPFYIRSNPAGDPIFGWEVTSHYWPFSSKKLDRTTNSIAFKYDKDYEVVLTLKPNITDPNYKLIAEVYEEGKKIGAGIMDQMTTFKPEYAKQLSRANLHIITRMATEKYEPVVYMKYMGIKAIQPDVPVKATYYPQDGETDAALNKDCYVDFEAAVEEVSVNQVEVKGGAMITGVRMENENKRVVVTLDGLAANASYTIRLKDVKAVNGDTAFDYSWSFTTGGGVEFSEPYYNSHTTLINENASDIDIAAMATTSTSDGDYLSGNKWASYTNNRADITPVFEVANNYLYAKLVNNGDTTSYVDRLYKKFEKIKQGDSLVLSGYINLSSEGRQEKDHSVMLTIGNGEDLQSNTYSVFRFVTLINSSNKYYLCGLEKNPGEFSSYMANYPSGGGVELRKWDWWNYHNDKNDPFYYTNDIPFVLTLSPDVNDNNYYNAEIDIANGRFKGTRKIPASEVVTFDTVAITMWQKYTVTTGKYVGFKDLKIAKGKLGIEKGACNLKIDYTNLSGTPFNADILIVERDPVTNSIINVNILKQENIEGDAGTINCDFEIEQEGTKVDVYILNSVEGMILLSPPKTFDVKS